ncbi:MAG TPA: winged helix-turn-helix domain-containing protein [Solirubrobacteraceae bacterium]|jgi:DNA-binding transcriptional ArsR family regulator
MPEDHAPPASSEDDALVPVNDPRSIRALAHPARLAIINALATGDELTATQCAELTELSPSATAYHLKLLERYGFAEPAPPRADRRERPWRATGRRTTVDLDSSTPAGASAVSGVAAAYIDTTRAVALEFTAGEHAEPEEWRNAALSNADLWLTAEEAKRVSHELEAVLEPLRGRALPGERPQGSRRVRVMNVVVPHPRTHPQPVPRGP